MLLSENLTVAVGRRDQVGAGIGDFKSHGGEVLLKMASNRLGEFADAFAPQSRDDHTLGVKIAKPG
jgi:hypothetical protein